jgi:hypothetical protein
MKLDAYEPDYDTQCECCGNAPVVTGVKDGITVLWTTLCGVCTWGSAEFIDPIDC